jgi:uncharacterized membrane protein
VISVDLYPLLRLGHVAGFILLGGGLAAVFLADWRGRRTRDVRVFAATAHFTALFYDALVVPGALLLAASGLGLVFELGLGFLDAPWLVGMWGLFLFELVEGNTVTRVVYRRSLKQAQDALSNAAPAAFASQSLVGRFTHFLDLPLFAVIVYCGVIRPESWAGLGMAVSIAVAIAVALTLSAPRPAMGPRIA